MSVASLKSDGDNRLSIEGELVFATVGGLLQQVEPYLKGQTELVVDLGKVSAVDSAGLALMLEWMGRCKASNRGIRFHHVPDSLLEIARLSNLYDILPLGGKPV